MKSNMLFATTLAIILLATQISAQITFTRVTTTSPWSPRHDASVKQVDWVEYSTSPTVKVNATNAFVFFSGRVSTSGPSYNDVWITSDFLAWTLGAGVTDAGVRANYSNGTSSFIPKPLMAEVQNYINTELYLFGGCTSLNSMGAVGATSERWRSLNGGTTWTQLTGALTFTPRCGANGVVASTGIIYLMSGFLNNNYASNDVWRSLDRGNSFVIVTTAAIWAKRASASVFIQSSAVLGVDVLYILGGHNVDGVNNRFLNDVWASNNGGLLWSLVTATASWSAREAPGMEITPEGMIVLVGGNSNVEGGVNDVWVSLDGGLNFGSCVVESPWSDRWWPATVMTNDGTFYIVGGTGGGAGFSDVWRSNQNLRQFNTFATACGNLRIPAVRGLGLQCWPPTSTCSVSLYTTAPKTSYTFDTLAKVGNNASWLATSGAHSGVAVFNGVNQFINLLDVTDRSNSRLFPKSTGGSISFEFWANFRSFRRWSRLIELSADGDNHGNVLIGNLGQSNSFALHVYPDIYGPNVHNVFEVTNIFEANQWTHVVCSMQQTTPGIYNTQDSALYACYINGSQILGSKGVVPPIIARPEAWLGKSAWTGDQYFDGMIDSFYFYDYALSADQVQARFVLPRPPIFDLAFAYDPRPFLGITTSATYSWTTISSTDFNGTSTNLGILELNGDGQYVNLNTPSGTSSVGTTLPTLPAVTGGDGLATGLTFEVLFKTPDQQNWGKIFDLGAGYESNNIILGFVGGSWDISFEVWRGNVNNGNQRLVAVANAMPGSWYHVVVTLVPVTGVMGNWTTYVNGVQSNFVTGYYPLLNTPRTSSYLGRSNWASDEYFNGSIDTFRVYDYAVSRDVIQNLYSVVKLPDLFKSGPVNTYRFNTKPTYIPDRSGSNYTWQQTVDGHSGIATFDGVNNFINLLTIPDDNGVFFPRTYGGGLSFELWTKYNSFPGWARQIDLGNGPLSDNILIAQANDANTLDMHIYTGSNMNGLSIPNAWKLNTWQHVLCSVSQRSPKDFTSNTAAVYQCFIDGVLKGQTYGPLPAKVPRASPYMARSNWNDRYFAGSIDAFYWYDYGLNREQALAHYIVPKPPVFELAFDFDPLPYMGLTQESAGYKWSAYASDEFNDTKTYSGVIELNGDGQYVNLGVNSGPYSIGTTLPTIGGPGSGTADEGNQGWSFEVLFKSPDEQTYARVFDFGAGPGIDSVAFWNSAATRNLQFSTWNSRIGTDRIIMPVILDLEYGKWYHVVITVVPNGASTTTTTQTAWVNGVNVASIPNGLPIDAVARPNSFIGRSGFVNNNDQFFNGTIDTLRIYDYALTPDVIGKLFVNSYTPDLTGDDTPTIPVGGGSSTSGGATAAIVIVVLVLVALAIGGGYYYYKRSNGGGGGGGGSSILGGGMSSFFGTNNKQGLLETELEGDGSYKPLSFRPGPQI